VGDQDRLVEDGGRLQVARPGQFIGPGNQLPGAPKDAVALFLEDGLVEVGAGR
jgi:hypothetical protein